MHFSNLLKTIIKVFLIEHILEWWTCRYTKLKDWGKQTNKKNNNRKCNILYQLLVCVFPNIFFSIISYCDAFNSLCSWNLLTWKCLLSHYGDSNNIVICMFNMNVFPKKTITMNFFFNLIAETFFLLMKRLSFTMQYVS